MAERNVKVEIAGDEGEELIARGSSVVINGGQVDEVQTAFETSDQIAHGACGIRCGFIDELVRAAAAEQPVSAVARK